MTKRDFEKVADDIGLQLRRVAQDGRSHDEEGAAFAALWDLAELLAGTFAGINRAFDPDRFYDRIRSTATNGLPR